MRKKNCPLCHKEPTRDFGKECKTCGMILEDHSRDFCCKICRARHVKIQERRFI